MGSNMFVRWRVLIFLGLSICSSTVWAGGPIIYNESDGQPLPWLNNRAVYVVETGKLGAVDNARASAIVEQAFQTWAATPTADLRIENLQGLFSPEELAT